MNDHITFETIDDEGYEIEVRIPAKWEVCPRCEGAGKHVNPAIDGNGLSREDFDEDPDFAEDYMSGVYDIACEECGGRTTVKVPDYDRMTEEQKEQWEKHQQFQAEMAREKRYQERFGY